MRKIFLATQNQGKIIEFRNLLADLKIELGSLQELPEAKEVIENGSTFEENAYLKAKYISDLTGLPTIADDSGLEVDYLQGEPGIFSARYALLDGGKIAGNIDQANNKKLLSKLQDVPWENRKARFVCVLAMIFPQEEVCYAKGTCEGLIAVEPRGSEGFGYDPLFYLPEFKRTMAELTLAEKNEISHRGRAYLEARNIIKKNLHFF